MPSFAFRLRVHLSDGSYVGTDTGTASKVVIHAPPDGPHLVLMSANSANEGRARQLNKSDRIALVGAPYESFDLAQEAADYAKKGLLQWSIAQQVGVDFGGRSEPPSESFLFQYAARHIESPLRKDLHGIDVYEDVPGLKFVEWTLRASNTTVVDKLRTSLVTARTRPMTDKQVLAGEIFSSSFFDATQRSRFVSLVTAVEALLDPRLRPTEVQAVVDKFLETVSQSKLEEATKSSLEGSVKQLRRESINQAGRRLAKELLAERTCDGMPPAKFFTHVYEERSRIVHLGAVSPSIKSLAQTTQTFVKDLLIASMAATLNECAGTHGGRSTCPGNSRD